MTDLEPDYSPSDTEGCLVDAELLDPLVMEVFSVVFGKHLCKNEAAAWRGCLAGEEWSGSESGPVQGPGSGLRIVG